MKQMKVVLKKTVDLLGSVFFFLGHSPEVGRNFARKGPNFP
jgi:hypothetical protein